MLSRQSVVIVLLIAAGTVGIADSVALRRQSISVTGENDILLAAFGGDALAAFFAALLLVALPSTAVFGYIVSVSIIVSKAQFISTVDCNDQTLAFDICAATAIIAVAHTASRTIIKIDRLRTIVCVVFDCISGIENLIVICIRNRMIMSPEQNNLFTGICSRV